MSKEPEKTCGEHGVSASKAVLEGFFDIWDLKMEQISSPAKIVTFKWKEEGEDGTKFEERAVLTAAQYDEVVKEFTEKLAKVYRPSNAAHEPPAANKHGDTDDKRS